MALQNLVVAGAESVDAVCPRHSKLDSLLVRVGAGDRDAFASFYDAMSQTVYGMSLSSGRGPAVSAQVTLDVFLRAWQQAGAFDPESESAWTWVRSIACAEINSQQGRSYRTTAQVGSHLPLNSAALRRPSHV